MYTTASVDMVEGRQYHHAFDFVAHEYYKDACVLLCKGRGKEFG